MFLAVLGVLGLAHFFFVGRSRKEKVIKKKRRIMGLRPKPRPLLKKRGKTNAFGECKHPYKSQIYIPPNDALCFSFFSKYAKMLVRGVTFPFQNLSLGVKGPENKKGGDDLGGYEDR